MKGAAVVTRVMCTDDITDAPNDLPEQNKRGYQAHDSPINSRPIRHSVRQGDSPPLAPDAFTRWPATFNLCWLSAACRLGRPHVLMRGVGA